MCEFKGLPDALALYFRRFHVGKTMRYKIHVTVVGKLI